MKKKTPAKGSVAEALAAPPQRQTTDAWLVENGFDADVVKSIPRKWKKIFSDANRLLAKPEAELSKSLDDAKKKVARIEGLIERRRAAERSRAACIDAFNNEAAAWLKLREPIK